MKRFPWISAALLILLTLVAMATPLLPLADPTKMDMAGRFGDISVTNWLGQDEYGRDVLSRLLWGARTTLVIAFASALLAGVVGIAMGVLGGYFGGIAEFLTLRTSDVLLCFPPLLLALLVVTLFGPGAETLIPILALVYVPSFARVAYSGVISVRRNDYVEAVRVLGARAPRIMARTVFPNVLGPLLVQFSIVLAAAIVLESGLSFLGLGVVPPASSWGLMVGAARSTMNQAPELLLWPALALTLTVLLINAFCDGIRDLIDPRSPVMAPRRPANGALIPQADDEGATPLEIRDLGIEIATPGGVIKPVRDVSLTLAPAEIVAVVGESGSGKSLLSLASMGLLPEAAWVSKGSIRVKGRDVVGRSEAELAVLRGKDIAMVFQDASASLNAVYRAGTQVEETLRAHGTASAEARRSRVLSLLRQVGIPDPARVARRYPHELSGGMRQRVMIAAAIANDPAIIIADESTTALDVTVQAQVLDLLVSLKDELGVSILFVTHSLPVVSEIADRIVVLYAGEVVEEGPADAVLAAPRHAYTRALLESAPREDGPPPTGIPGSVPAPGQMPPGCVFEPRCAFRVPACREHPALVETGDGRRSRCIRWKDLA